MLFKKLYATINFMDISEVDDSLLIETEGNTDTITLINLLKSSISIIKDKNKRILTLKQMIKKYEKLNKVIQYEYEKMYEMWQI